MRVKTNLKDLLVLFWTFFKIGLFTFGGGYSMIPLIEREIVEKKVWLDQSVASDMVAIAEATPGPIAVNMATFVGCQRCGILGAFFSTLGLIIPSFVIIIVISLCLALVQDNVWVESAFKGIRRHKNDQKNAKTCGDCCYVRGCFWPCGIYRHRRCVYNYWRWHCWHCLSNDNGKQTT